MAEYRLHCFYNSGNAFKVVMMLDLTGCDWEAVPVAPGGDAVHNQQWWAMANTFNEVPVLEHNGAFHSQSAVILNHLANTTGHFGGRDETERAEVWRWLLFDNHKFTGNFSMLRYLCAIERTGETSVTEYLRARVRKTWSIVETHLKDRDFILGDQPTVADFSMAGYHYYGEDTGIDRASEFPNIDSWTKRISRLPGWRPPEATMPRT